MKRLILVVLMIFSLVLLTSCNNQSDWQKAEHTFSQLGVKVSYKYPYVYKIKTWEENLSIGIFEEPVNNTLDWSITMDISDLNYVEFEDFKGAISKTASDIKQKDGIWTFIYNQPQEGTVILKRFECGKLLVLQKANDFNYDDAFEIAKTFDINVLGEDIR
ncbi:MAG: hypothetical protein J6D52_01855 [Clostridia bacterium]|nr:hypothetical protein [Clostridia bacterium]